MIIKKILVFAFFIAFYFINAFVFVTFVEKRMPLKTALDTLETPMWVFYIGAFIFFIFFLFVAKLIADRIK